MLRAVVTAALVLRVDALAAAVQKVAVTGATGRTGSLIYQSLLDMARATTPPAPFSGSYSDPNHPSCARTVVVSTTHPDRGSVSYYSGSHSNPDDGDGDGDGARRSFLHAAAATHNRPSHVYRSLSFAGWCIAEPRGGGGGIVSRGGRLRR